MIITARDAQDALLGFMGGNNDAQATMHVRESIHEAMNEIWGHHHWPYYLGQRTFQIDPMYETGTITYVASTRLMTLTGGTWPTWAEYGTIVIGSSNAKVAKRLSDTVIELDTGSSFTSNLATATDYKIYRNEYPLDNDVKSIGYVAFDRWSNQPLLYIPSLEFNHPGTIASGTPRYFSIQKDRRQMGGTVIIFWPVPPTAKSVSFTYLRKPKDILIWSKTDGRVEVTADDATVAGTGTSFIEECEGCVFRIGRNTQPVTSTIGANPYAEQTIVNDYTSSTAIECHPVFETSRSNVSYEISSMIDIDEPTMKTMFNLQCQYQLMLKRSVQNQNIELISRALQQAIRSAKSRSKPNRGVEYAGSVQRSVSMVWVPASV